MSSRKVPPVIPVVQGAGANGDPAREQQLLAWEQEQQARRERESAASTPPPAPAAAAVPASPAGGAVETPAAAPSGSQVVPDAGASAALLPDASPAAEILARCEQIIIAATVEAGEQVRKVETAWLSTIGPAVRQVHRTKAYKQQMDAAGRPYRSFKRWAYERCGVSRPHAYRIVSEGPVAEALAPLYTGALATRQVDVLAPVLRQHGADAVRRVWAAAEATGSTGAAALAVKRDVLELTTAREDDEPEKTPVGVEPAATLALVRKAAHGVDREMLRQAAKADPDGARNAVTAALQFASDLQQALDELNALGAVSE